jgi:hypothetical protein
MNGRKLRQWHIFALAGIYTCLSSLLVVSTALAHDAPPGDEYQMADWMLFSFLIFFGVSFVIFLVAVKRGWMSFPESAKYELMNIDEPDYYTPDWAKEAREEEPDPTEINPVGNVKEESYG